MRFGYVWRGRDALPDREQEAFLAEYRVAPAKVFREKAPARDERDQILSVVRPGDEICVYSARYIADDIIELHRILAHLAEREAALYVIEFSEAFQGSRAMARLTEDYVDTRRKEQTRAARERLKKLPAGSRGGRPPAIKMDKDRRLHFKQLWADRTVSTADMAREFDCHKSTISREAKKMKLGPKAV